MKVGARGSSCAWWSTSPSKKGPSSSGTLDSPDQGANGLKLSSIVIDESRLAFELKDLGAKFEGKLNAAKTEAAGTWTQGGGTTPLTLVKKDKATPEPKIVGKEQIWEGKLALNAGIQLRFVLRVAKTEEGGTVAKLDSLDEGLKGLKLSSVILDKSQLSFDLKMSSARYEGKLNADGTEATGYFLQSGAQAAAFVQEDRQGHRSSQAADAQAAIPVHRDAS